MDSMLIEILSDYLSNKASTATVSPELISLAQSHQVMPIVYYQTKDKSLYQSYLYAISVYTQRKALLRQITEAFSDIPFYTVKGFSVSQYYPVPPLRTMGDCDIIVRECDKERAGQRLRSLSFEEQLNDMEWHYRKQGLDFELHHLLLYDETVNTEAEKAFADTAWDHVHDHELDVDFHFAYILIHLKKHLMNQGVGIRQFMDLAVMSMNAPLDRETISGYLAQVGLEKFAGVCSALCRRWFGVVLPVDTPELSDEFYAHATETILANGVFGFEVAENSGKSLWNSVSRYGKVGSVRSKFFPSYKNCAASPKYRWVRGKPYLMPVLWACRPFEFLFSGRIGEGFEHIARVAKSDAAVAEHHQELMEWGL